MLIVTLSSAAAFLVSFLLVTGGVRAMAVRYGLAALTGYGVFLLLIGTWIRWKSSHLVGDTAEGVLDVVVDASDLPMPRLPRGGGTGRIFSGGNSGGGGAVAAFDGPATTTGSVASVPSRGGGGFSLDFDADDLIWVIVAVAALFAGALAVGYVVYVAPTLLAEAAVNAAVAGKVYQGMKRHDSTHWTTQVIRRTIVSAIVVVLSAVTAGYALQRIAPEARSIGGVWQHMRDK
jgi:hypothetical protein